MKTFWILLSLVLIPAPLLTAQGPQPAPELERFEPMLGNWEGTGKYRPTADAEEMEWTSTMTVTKILGGHVIQEDSTVNVGMPDPLYFRSLYWWDRAAGRFKVFSVTNSGEASVADIYWISATRMTGSATKMEDGIAVTDRWVTEFDKDAYSFKVERACEDGDFFTHVSGSYKRGKAKISASENTGDRYFMTEPHDKMKWISGMIGSWNLTGTRAGSPGKPRMEITGTEEVKAILGGHVVMNTFTGKSGPGMAALRSNSYIAWNVHDRKYLVLTVNNFGTAAIGSAAAPDRKTLVIVNASLSRGIPQVSRALLEFTGKDKITMKTHRCAGTQDPELSFEGTLERIRTDQ